MQSFRADVSALVKESQKVHLRRWLSFLILWCEGTVIQSSFFPSNLSCF